MVSGESLERRSREVARGEVDRILGVLREDGIRY